MPQHCGSINVAPIRRRTVEESRAYVEGYERGARYVLEQIERGEDTDLIGAIVKDSARLLRNTLPEESS